MIVWSFESRTTHTLTVVRNPESAVHNIKQMIKKADIFSIIIFSIGTILIITQAVLEINEIMINFPFWIIGLICVPISIVISIISGVSKMDDSKTTISNLITPMYKILVVPVHLIINLAFGLIIYAMISNNVDVEFIIGICVFLIVSLIMSVRMIKAIKKLMWLNFDSENIHCAGLRFRRDYKISDIRNMKRILNGLFYQIDFNTNESIVVMPRLIEYFDSLYGEPKSVGKLRKIRGLEQTDNYTKIQDKLIGKIFKK